MSLFSSVFTGFESPEEKRKFSILAVLFGLTIVVYWLFRPLKDSIFLTMVGRDYQPWAKMLSIASIKNFSPALKKMTMQETKGLLFICSLMKPFQ